MRTYLLYDSYKGRVFLEKQGIRFEKTKQALSDNLNGHMSLWSIIAQQTEPCMIITDKVCIDSELQNYLVDLFNEADPNGFMALYSESSTLKSKIFSKRYGLSRKVYYAITPIELKAYILSPAVAKILSETVKCIDDTLFESQVLLQLQKNLIRPLFVKPGLVQRAKLKTFQRRRRL